MRSGCNHDRVQIQGVGVEVIDAVTAQIAFTYNFYTVFIKARYRLVVRSF